MYDLSIKIENYKCFKNKSGFDTLKRVNIIIGRNNVGKSVLLDLIHIVAKQAYKFDSADFHKLKRPKVFFKSIITEDTINKTFPADLSGGILPSINHRDYGRKLIGRNLEWSIHHENPEDKRLINCDDEGITPTRISNPRLHQYAKSLCMNMPILLQGKYFRRVSAERDVVPESDIAGNIIIESNGAGLTNAIQSVINRSSLPSDLVEVDLLKALNVIFAGDASFERILCQQHVEEDDKPWEIYLHEKNKGPIALSKSGSGLKTIMTVLACLFIVPMSEGRELYQYIFCFEELENNLHPALQRRLYEYLYESSIKFDFIYFLTTHSNILIDQFSKSDDAQIIHVTQIEGESNTNVVTTYIESNGVLDDLDVKASDLLQANGIIWVEGPSDRIYLNRWISIWSDDKLQEGTQYQIIFYGGRLLSHLSADSPDLVDDCISILNTNRNALILMDSDKKNRQASINSTKLRIKEEFKKIDSDCWITKGKEIENYIPSEVIDKFLEKNDSPQVGQYDDFFEYLYELKSDLEKKYSKQKLHTSHI